LNNEEATKSTIDKYGWLHTGDIVYFDQDGYLYLSDRLKEFIKYKGFQVSIFCLLNFIVMLDIFMLQFIFTQFIYIVLMYITHAVIDSSC